MHNWSCIWSMLYTRYTYCAFSVEFMMRCWWQCSLIIWTYHENISLRSLLLCICIIMQTINQFQNIFTQNLSFRPPVKHVDYDIHSNNLTNRHDTCTAKQAFVINAPKYCSMLVMVSAVQLHDHWVEFWFDFLFNENRTAFVNSDLFYFLFFLQNHTWITCNSN